MRNVYFAFFLLLLLNGCAKVRFGSAVGDIDGDISSPETATPEEGNVRPAFRLARNPNYVPQPASVGETEPFFVTFNGAGEEE